MTVHLTGRVRQRSPCRVCEGGGQYSPCRGSRRGGGQRGWGVALVTVQCTIIMPCSKASNSVV